MADAMVTARMPQWKKDKGSSVLSSLGLNASSVINKLYDFLIEKGDLPDELREEQQHKTYTPEQLAEALAWADSLPQINRFTFMTDKEMKDEKMRALLGEAR